MRWRGFRDDQCPAAAEGEVAENYRVVDRLVPEGLVEKLYKGGSRERG
jgi:hypothetical protein